MRIQNFRVACILALVFMPAGAVLDLVVYREQLSQFFVLRMTCSAFLLFIWWFVTTAVGSRYYQVLGLLLPALPTLCIALMILETEGPSSPYYAGLNLVLLGAAIILRWTLVDSVVVFLEVIAIYLAACFLHPLMVPEPRAFDWITFANNTYFLLVTGCFVVIGSYFYNRLRFREFALRFELDRNRAQLEESNRKLVELDQAKSRFFANISHELRTPLTLLMSPLETLIHGYGRTFDEETRGVLKTMHSNGMRLLKLINDLLDLVRLDSGVMQAKREGVQIPEFIRGLVSAARHVAVDKKIDLRCEVDPDMGTVMVDRDKLEKIILNLQFNALKFTPSGGRVEVHARIVENQVVFQVKDTGMGISAGNLPFVFDRFWQADTSARRKHQGVGIGLALVKELTEVHGGKVSVESQEGVGTTFTVSLPVIRPDVEPGPAIADPSVDAPVDAQASVPVNRSANHEEWLVQLYRRAELFPATATLDRGVASQPARHNGMRPTILIADDEPDILRFLTSQLGLRYQVVGATNGREAVELAVRHLPDVILLDMMMPEKDGLQASRELRENAQTQNIPIIMLTARADEETKLAALSAGVSDFLPKPFSTTELHVRVKNLSESRDFQKKLARQNQVLESTIVHLKETELQLVQTEKIASLGRMSAGIIHEINNPLNFAATGLFTIRKKCRAVAPDRQAELAEVLNDVEEGINRVKSIVSDLRTFTHPDATSRGEVSVAEAAAHAMRFLSSEWKGRVRIVQSLPKELTVWANKNHLIQVLLNLLQNSLDAIKRKGCTDDSPTIWIAGRLEGERAVLSVRDNGDGIDPACIGKIFDPFFTTKDVGEGMGMGLSISYRIIKEHGGTIRVDSTRGRYTEMTLELPVSETGLPTEIPAGALHE